MAVGDKIKCKVRIESKRFYNADSDFGIVLLSVLELEEGEPVLDTYGCFIAKGMMPDPKVGGHYLLTATELSDPKWGKQYQIVNMCTSVSLEKNDKQGQRVYLETIFTPQQVEAMYEALENPFESFDNGDVESLLKIKGCGIKTAPKWLSKFKLNIEMSRIYVGLQDYDLTSNMVRKLYDHYGSADLVIQNVQKNPYSLIDLRGIGWKKCDELAQKGGMGIFCSERVEAFIKHYLEQMAENGYTFVYSNSQLMDSIMENLGEDIPDEPIIIAIKQLGDRLWWSEDHEQVGLSRYVNLERKIAEKLIELNKADNSFKYENWEQIINRMEELQGWEFTDQQLEGIKAVIEKNVVIITGFAGTGKSTIVSGMLEVLREYSFAQCALAGRAAARLAEVTHQEGYTIHRLLGFPKGDDNHGGFVYHEDNPLDYDIIILDEISMVDGQLFYSLLRAIRPGTKLILLGDVGQLESIGCSNIAHDLIESPEIKCVQLDKIHRQAEASAIITDSIKARKNLHVIEKDWVGVETRGELQDLTYDCFSDVSNTFYKVMQYVSEYISSDVNILDFQVIVPIKERDAGTWNLNLAIQEIYNPLESQDEILVKYDANHAGYLRVGDKVMNMSNNYKCVTYEGQWDCDKDMAEDMGITTPVYNGNIGIVSAINPHRYEIVVDFVDIGSILISKDKIGSVMLGYAITTHKFQGSSSPYVIVGIDFSSYSLLTKEMFYTAVTRASKKCTVVAQTGALRYAILQNGVSNKQTLLQEFLYEVAHPKLKF